MTDTEKIAVGLFQWEPWDDPDMDEGYRAYLHSDYLPAYVCINWPKDVASAKGESHYHWPDFTDDRLRWYWIRRVEDALADRGLLESYMLHLNNLYTVTSKDPLPGTCISWQELAMLRATVEQRLAAALKCLEACP